MFVVPRTFEAKPIHVKSIRMVATDGPRVYNKHHYNKNVVDAVYIGRGSKWGNPFVIGKDGTREEVIAKYKTWVQLQPGMVQAIKKELKGKNLLCFCKPAKCHGDWLLEVANQ